MHNDLICDVIKEYKTFHENGSGGLVLPYRYYHYHDETIPNSLPFRGWNRILPILVFVMEYSTSLICSTGATEICYEVQYTLVAMIFCQPTGISKLQFHQ